MPKPKVFIGSSSEALRKYADAIFSELERQQLEPTVWDAGVFRSLRATLEDLDRIRHAFDFAVLVFTPDDQRTSRGVSAAVARDNVVAELGLFLGSLGRDRVFVVGPRTGIELPSDLLGVRTLVYEERSDGDLQAAVRTACAEIANSALQLAPRAVGPAPVRFWQTIDERRADGVEPAALIRASRERVFLSGIGLNFLVERCAADFHQALEAGARVDVVLAARANPYDVLSSPSPERARVARDALRLAHARWRRFWEKLPAPLQERCRIGATERLLTHSIGLYDDQAVISEMMLGINSQRAPAYLLTPAHEAFAAFFSEATVLSEESTPLAGRP